MASYGPLGGHTSTDQLGTTYNPRHKRIMSETDREEMADIADEISLLEQEKRAYEAYDPTTRSGRPSFQHSAASSPMLNPAITVTSHEPSPLYLPSNYSSTSGNRSRSGKGSVPGPWAKFLARLRFILIALALSVAAVIVGVNASILATYNSNKRAGKWMNQAGGARIWWYAWPKEGVDMRPITAYLGLGAITVVVMTGFFIASAHTRFRYLNGGLCRTITVCIATIALTVLWTLVAIFLQFQAIGNNGKHSFRTWACSHTDKNIYSMPDFQFAALCSEANYSRYGGLASGGLSLAILLTVILGCCAGRRSKSYGKVASPGSQGSWMPKWGRK